MYLFATDGSVVIVGETTYESGGGWYTIKVCISRLGMRVSQIINKLNK